MRRGRSAEAVADLARRLQELHVEAERPTFDLMAKVVFARTGLNVKAESFRRAHAGEADPTQVNVELLLALVAFYRCSPETLGSAAADRLNGLYAAVTKANESPWTRYPQVRLPFPVLADVA